MERAREPQPHRIAFLLTWAAAATYALVHLNVGWFPADAGTIGQAAERVLAGELPHRDFADVYTGGLAMLHAAAFEVLGISVMSMRWVTYLIYLGWLPAVWTLAARLGGVAAAVLATLLAAAWSLPVYPEAMPSWYNLFLATFGVLALLRFSDTRHRRWILAAGFVGGLSITVKIVGLYYVAGAVAFLLHDEARTARTRVAAGGDDGTYRRLVVASVAVLAGVVAWLVIRAMGPRHFFLYGVPPVVALMPVLIGVARPTGLTSRARFLETSHRLGLLGVGVALPIAVFLTPYALTGSIPALFQGVFVQPSARLDMVRMIGPSGQWWFAAPAVVLIGWHVVADRWGPALDRTMFAMGVSTWLLVLATSSDDFTYLVTFRTLTWLSPLVAIIAAWRIKEVPDAAPLLALLGYGFMSLVQVPFAAPAYFFYAAPLATLVALAAMQRSSLAVRVRALFSLAAILAFSGLRLNEGIILDLGYRYRQDPLTERLQIPRAMGLHVTPEDKEHYETLVGVLSAVPGRALYAGPDAPEVYFLSGRTNATRTLYDLLDGVEDREAQVLDAIERANVPVVVVRPDPLFSAPLPPSLLAELERRFPAAAEVGPFIVAWRP